MDILGHRFQAAVIHWWWAVTGKPSPKLTVPLPDLIALYLTEADDERIDGEVAFAQAIHETGFFQYGGDVDWTQNNFAGIGATGGGVPGHSFPTARLGVRAHVQHLKAYADPQITAEELAHPVVDPRFDLVRKGSAPRWEDLGGKWAPSPTYGLAVLDVYERMKSGL